MLNNNNVIRIKGLFNYIDPNLFEKIKPKIISFVTEDCLSLFKDGGYWLNTFDLIQTPVTSNLFEISIETYKPMNLSDENLCYFKNVPTNRAYLISPSLNYFKFECTCSFAILFSTYLNLKNSSYNFRSYFTQLAYTKFQNKKCLNHSFLSECLDKVKLCDSKLSLKMSPDYNLIYLSLNIEFYDIILSQIIILFVNLDKVFVIVVNDNELVGDFDFGNEFLDRNTFINSMFIRLSRKIQYN
ncbi:unnamed protein product, partial [Brachionus calyciflorus]